MSTDPCSTRVDPWPEFKDLTSLDAGDLLGLLRCLRLPAAAKLQEADNSGADGEKQESPAKQRVVLRGSA
jgi:hypothetical protein